MKKKNDPTLFFLLAGVSLILAIAAAVFLFSKDSYGQYTVSGWEVLKMQSTSFYVTLVFCWIIGAAAVYLAYANASGSGIGKRLSGNDGFTIALIVLALLLFFLPMARVFTDKANGGVTAPGYKSVLK